MSVRRRITMPIAATLLVVRSVAIGQLAPDGAELQVNTYTTAWQLRPAVAADALGNFVVIWQGRGASEDGYGIQGQRYDSGGTPQGSQFQVNVYTTGNQTSPAVAADPAGNFVVVWDSYGSAGSDGSS